MSKCIKVSIHLFALFCMWPHIKIIQLPALFSFRIKSIEWRFIETSRRKYTPSYKNIKQTGHYNTEHTIRYHATKFCLSQYLQLMCQDSNKFLRNLGLNANLNLYYRDIEDALLNLLNSAAPYHNLMVKNKCILRNKIMGLDWLKLNRALAYNNITLVCIILSPSWYILWQI